MMGLFWSSPKYASEWCYYFVVVLSPVLVGFKYGLEFNLYACITQGFTMKMVLMITTQSFLWIPFV